MTFIGVTAAHVDVFNFKNVTDWCVEQGVKSKQIAGVNHICIKSAVKIKRKGESGSTCMSFCCSMKSCTMT